MGQNSKLFSIELRVSLTSSESFMYTVSKATTSVAVKTAHLNCRWIAHPQSFSISSEFNFSNNLESGILREPDISSII
jgi:hypothetical protein